MKAAAGGDRGGFFGLNEEMVGEALAAFDAGVDQVGDLHDSFWFAAGLLGFSGRRIGLGRGGRRRGGGGFGLGDDGRQREAEHDGGNKDAVS